MNSKLKRIDDDFDCFNSILNEDSYLLSQSNQSKYVSKISHLLKITIVLIAILVYIFIGIICFISIVI